jgi:SAM-dependent methyltransferase
VACRNVPSVRLADAISLRSRRRKLGLFLELMRPDSTTTVLDVGVDEVSLGELGGESGCTTHNFLEERYPWPERITALGLHDGVRFRERYPQIAYVQGDACALPFPDGAFDVVHSNAVIEHVGGRHRQEAFVREALRVGRRVFLTTPNRWFPIEVHTRLPLVHWLPERAAGRAYDLARMPWAKENHLLGARDLRALFPVPVRIQNLGMTLVATT